MCDHMKIIFDIRVPHTGHVWYYRKNVANIVIKTNTLRKQIQNMCISQQIPVIDLKYPLFRILDNNLQGKPRFDSVKAKASWNADPDKYELFDVTCVQQPDDVCFTYSASTGFSTELSICFGKHVFGKIHEFTFQLQHRDLIINLSWYAACHVHFHEEISVDIILKSKLDKQSQRKRKAESSDYNMFMNKILIVDTIFPINDVN